MNMRILSVAALTAGAVLAGSVAAAGKPKHSIKKVMKEAIKGDHALVKKACRGTATKDELAKMVEYFHAMTEDSPPRGDAESWKKKSAALHEAAVALQKDPQNKDLAFRLEQAVECRQCHNAHKPDKK